MAGFIEEYGDILIAAILLMNFILTMMIYFKVSNKYKDTN